MNTFRIIIFLFLIVVTRSPVSSQNRLYEFVDSNIAALKSQKIEPIILIGPEQYPMMIMGIELSNHRKVMVWESYYYLYRVDNETFLTRCVETVGNISDSNLLLKSEPIKISNDSLFQWLAVNDSEISKERILPYIFQDTSNGIISYDLGMRMHDFPYSLTILHGDQFQNFSFEKIAMQQYLIPGYSDFHQNLNYMHNSKTSIFKLYSKLEKILDLYGDAYNFNE